MDRYSDLKFNSGEYVPQYAGLPLEEIQKTGDVLSGRHYQNLAALNQLQLLREQYKSKMLPGASGYVDQHFGDIDQALQDIAQKGGENATAKVGAITNRFLGDQGVLKALQRAEEVQKEIELENQIVAKEGFALRKKGLRENLMKAPIIDPTTGELHSAYQTPYQSSVTSYIDPVRPMEEIWKTVNPDSIEGAIHAAPHSTIKELLGKSVDTEGMPDVPLFFENLTKAGISDKKITDNLKNAWSSYQQTPAFKQAVEYADNPEQEKTRQKDQFYKHGLLRVYENLQRQYMTDPIADDLFRKGGKEAPYRTPVRAPGEIVNSMFDYKIDDQGEYKSANAGDDITQLNEALIASDAGGSAVESATHRGQEGQFSEQYLKDYNTMAEIMGVPPPAKGSKEAKQLAKGYRQQVEERVSQTWTTPLTPEERSKIDNSLESEFALYEYMDPITGEVIESGINQDGKPSDDWVKLTGGDPSKFRVESVYDVKNNFTLSPAASINFVKPIAVVSKDKDGNVKRFFTSQPPGNVLPEDINANVIYTKANLRPGQPVQLTDNITVRELRGEQLKKAGFTPEDIGRATIPMEATIDGQVWHFDSPEHLAKYLLREKGIVLPLK